MAKGNFAVNASDEVIAQGKELLEKMAKPGEKQGDVLGRIFRIVEERQDGETMRQGGVDVQALDASLSNIRSMFLSSVTGKEQIVAAKDEKLKEIKTLKDQLEKDLREKLVVAQAEKEAAETAADEAVKAKEQAEREAAASEKIREAAEKTAADKQTIADSLAARLAEAEEKAKGYDDLKASLTAAQDALRKAAEDKKDAALSAEREKDQAVREVSDTLQAKITGLQDELRTARSDAEAARQAAEAAKASAIAELAETHRTEMAEIRTRLDSKTDELMQARQQAADAKIELQQEKAKVADLERQLEAALKSK